MEELLALVTNYILLVPGFTWLAVQIVKTIVDAIVNKKIQWSRLFGDGGMPSGHSATVMSLACMVGFREGFESAAFAVSMIAIKFLINFVKKHSFAPFGAYRIVLGTIVLGYFLIK